MHHVPTPPPPPHTHTHKNTRKPYGFLMFSGGWEKEWVKEVPKITVLDISENFSWSNLENKLSTLLKE